MSKMMVLRTDAPLPDETGMAAVRHFLFVCFTGFLDADKKGWNRFWRRYIKFAPGEMALAEMIFPRNYKFHKKFMALMNFGFESWEPARVRKTYKGMPVQKNFERFRKDITIAAGFYEQTFDLEGRMHLEAQSISFASMDDEQFDYVYSAVADVLLDRVFSTYNGRPELDRVMEQLVGFLR